MKKLTHDTGRDNLNHATYASRRSFMKWAAAAACLSAFPAMAKNRVYMPERKLAIYNTHTSEILNVAYWEQGEYIPEAMDSLNKILRDHRTNEIAPIDRRLFDLLHVLHHRLEGKQPFHVISGFRSPASNAILTSSSPGVAKTSLHMTGQAIDIRLPECELSNLRQAAQTMGAGGVGYYPGSNFVHVDVGRIRSW